MVPGSPSAPALFANPSLRGMLILMSSDRRAISLNGITYTRLRHYADELGASLSGLVEEIVAENLDRHGVPVPDRLEPRARREPEPEPLPEEIAAEVKQHFSF